MQSHAANLKEKTDRYMVMFQRALRDIEVTTSENSYLNRIADDFLNMANSYYNDGMHFRKKEDPVNALACFSYGHAWLDAGARLGIFSVKDEVLDDEKL